MILMLGFAVVAPVASAPGETVPLGAAVSWVAYDDRGDFIANRRLLREIIEQHEMISPTEPQEFFRIPAPRHFEVPVDGEVFVNAQKPSFERELDKAISALESAAVTTAPVFYDPFLVVAISSHGDNGWLGRGYGSEVRLDDLAALILQKRRLFESRTGLPLRLEILYSACYSGSIIQAFKKKMNDPGAISILTTTSEEELSYSDVQRGDFLFNTVLQLASGARKTAERLPQIKAHLPTLTQFGFFRHLGSGVHNHPQIYSSIYQWTSQDTMAFLDWYRESGHGFSSESFYRRDLKLNIEQLMNNSANIEDASQVLDASRWNQSIAASSEIINQHLHSPLKHVRYATALFVLEYLKRFLSLKTQADLSVIRPFEAEAKKLVVEWIGDPDFEKTVGSGNYHMFFWNSVIEILPVESIHMDQTLSFLERFDRHHESGRRWTVSRSSMDKLREILTVAYGIRNLAHVSQAENALRQVPPRIINLILRMYFGLRPLKDNKPETLLQAILEGRQNLRQRTKILAICEGLLQNPTLASLNELAVHAIQNYDRGMYTDPTNENFRN